MMAHYTFDHIREHAHIGITITSSTDVESLAVLVSNVINQFNLVSRLFGITGDDRTNLAICKAILESNFDNTGVFELENPMFVMECFAHVLDNKCKAVLIDLKSDNGRVYT